MSPNHRTKLSHFSLACFLAACAPASKEPADDSPAGDPSSDADAGHGGDPDPQPGADAGTAPTAALSVRLRPEGGVSGPERVNFAIPLPQGLLDDEGAVAVFDDASEVPAARRGLARYPDGSLRSVQVQVELDLSGPRDLLVVVGRAPETGFLALVPVAETLIGSGNDVRPRVAALLEAEWLSASAVAGPTVAHAEVAGSALDAWGAVCDYDRYDTAAFLAAATNGRGAWLFDRVTLMYRGYARTGGLGPLTSAYREAHIYRSGLTGSGTDTRIGIPTAESDLKYHYTQGMAIHYLLTGDDRFLQSIEDVATRAAALWPSPGYAGGSDMWTERHAGFALLAYVWAAKVSVERAAEFEALADEAVAAYLLIQETFPAGYSDAEARCFAHHASAHKESYGYFGCSPWMSAILADGLDAYATLRGGDQAAAAGAALVKLGRILAHKGRDANGKPYYWMGVGTDQNEVDPYDEHWGEPAYVVAMAWHHQGRTDESLRAAAEFMIARLGSLGRAPHLRSFNWQCRSAPLAQSYLAGAP